MIDRALVEPKLRELLQRALAPVELVIRDDSAAHAGHAGAQQGGGHYHVTIVSEAFEGKSMVQRHQLIYQALGDLMKQQIHALGINALSPSEKN